MTTYLVSGFMRSGTSMMMKALEAGGLVVAHEPKRNALIKRHSDEFYSPNKGGLYELTRQQYQEWGFPKKYKGKLIKCLYGGIIRLAAVDDFKVIFMRRDAEEIRQSYEAFFGQEFNLSTQEIDDRIALSLNTLHQRKDVQVSEVWYRNVIEEPLASFQTLQQEDWPIDAEAAAAIVNPELCRFKIENLTVGA